MRQPAHALYLALALILADQAAVAQTPLAPAASHNPPIEIEAETGIEWERDQQIVIARGNAKAVRADLTVTADMLKAYYRQRADGATEVYRLDGAGNVKITSPSETAWGDAATYDVATGALVLTSVKGGKRVRMVTGQNEVTARDRLDYTRPTRLLVAYGDAVATAPERQVKGDLLTAYLNETGSGRARFRSVDAEGNVDVSTPDERITSDRGRYEGVTDTATFTGSVRITSGDSVLNGCRADFDLTARFSTLSPCPAASGQTGRVHGVIVPNSKTN